MKFLIKTLVMLTLICALPMSAMAQMEELKNSTPQERADLQTQWMQTNLSLDSKVSSQVADLNLKYAKEMQTVIDSNSPPLKKMMSFKQNSTAKDAELKPLLTSEQYASYEQKKSEMEATIKQKLKEKHAASSQPAS
jgi:hypothetical protein